MTKRTTAILLLLTTLLASSCAHAPAESVPTIETVTATTLATLSEEEATVTPTQTSATETSPETTTPTETLAVDIDYVIEPVFDDATTFNASGHAVVGVMTDDTMKYGVIDETGVFAIEPEYDAYRIPTYEIDFYGPQMDTGNIWLQKDGLWGFINGTCEWVVEPRYEDCTLFLSFPLAGVKIDGKWGFVSTSGTMVVDPLYDEVEINGQSSRALVCKNDRWGLIDSTGKEILAPIYDDILMDGDRTEFDSWSSAGQDVLLVNYQSCLIRMDGEVIIDNAIYPIGNIGKNGLVYVNSSTSGNGYFNMEGELIIPLGENESGSTFAVNGLAIILTRSDDESATKFTWPDDGNNTFRYINSDGDTQFGKEFQRACDFAPNGLACVEVDGLYGFIDRNGDFVIEPQFDNAFDFNPDGYATVILDDKRDLIDSTGDLLTDFAYDRVSQVAPYGTDSSCFIAEKNGKAGLIDSKGNWILPAQYTHIISSAPKSDEGWNIISHSDTIYALTFENGKYGIITLDGEVILDPVSERGNLFIAPNGYVMIESGGKFGYVDIEK